MRQDFTPDSVAFQEKMVAKGGLGNETYLPVGADWAGDWCCLLALVQVWCLWADWALK